MGDLDLPYEASSGELTIDEHVHVAGGLVVMASAVELVEPVEHAPALVFRFAKPDGSGFYPAFILVTTPKQMRDLVRLVDQSVEAACEAAS